MMTSSLPPTSLVRDVFVTLLNSRMWNRSGASQPQAPINSRLDKLPYAGQLRNVGSLRQGLTIFS